MKAKLIRISIQDAKQLYEMQVDAFQDLYAKYKDTETSPATESFEQVLRRLEQPFIYHYYIRIDDKIVGAVRVTNMKDSGTPKRLSQIFIMKDYRNNGYAQAAIRLVEEIHGSAKWGLDTILQEKDLCRLYEKMGYVPTGKIKQINEQMTLVFYKKD